MQLKALMTFPVSSSDRGHGHLVGITATNICGSDVQMYEGRTDFETGRWFGHENMGEVIEVGDGVDKVKVGEHVVLPFNISCGFCKNCEHGYTNYCLTTQPEQTMAGAAYGFAAMGPWAGGQAELLRVPYGDHSADRARTPRSRRHHVTTRRAAAEPAGNGAGSAGFGAAHGGSTWAG